MKMKETNLSKSGAKLATKGETDALARKMQKDIKGWAKKTLRG